VQHDVAAGGDRAHRRLARRQPPRDGVHPHRVGVNEPVELHLATQQAGDDGGTERGGAELAGVELRHLDVRGHDAVGAHGNAGAERGQLDAIEPFTRLPDDRQADVGIDIGVAVTRKVLERGEHAAGAQSAHVGRHVAPDLFGHLAERSRVDHRVARVVVPDEIQVGKSGELANLGSVIAHDENTATVAEAIGFVGGKCNEMLAGGFGGWTRTLDGADRTQMKCNSIE